MSTDLRRPTSYLSQSFSPSLSSSILHTAPSSHPSSQPSPFPIHLGIQILISLFPCLSLNHNGTQRNMTNYPRQVDASLQQQQQHMEDTRKATPVSDTIDASDIQHLLAAINKQEARGKVQVPADHSIKRAPGVPEPVCSPTNQLRRVADILDALSALLISKPVETIIKFTSRVPKEHQGLFRQGGT